MCVCEVVREKEGDLVGLNVHSISNIESRPRGQYSYLYTRISISVHL